MNRRTSLGLIGCLGTPLILPAAGSNHHPSGWLLSFSERWKNSEIYTFEVLEAMPETMLNFQPTSEMMSFSKLFTHIGFGLEVYAEKLDGEAPGEEPVTTEKQTLFKYLTGCFEHFNNAFKDVKESELYSNKHHFPEEEPWKDFSIADIILLAYNHTIHHRAQATTYLRLKEIVPPKYRF